MPRVANKISAQQVDRLIRTVGKRAPDDLVIRAAAVLADQEETIAEGTLGEIADDPGWGASLVESIIEHAEGQGPGLWRYVVRAVRADGIVVGTTWARVNVRSDGPDDDPGLDGSVASYVQQLQRTIDQQNKANSELIRMQLDTMKSQSEMVRAFMDRQTLLERQREELEREVLESKAREIIAQAESRGATGQEEDWWQNTVRHFAPVVVDRVLEKFGPKLLAIFDSATEAGGASSDAPALPAGDAAPEGDQLSSGDAPEAAETADDREGD